MPYRERLARCEYYKGYYAGYLTATKHHLGGKCQECGSTRNLQLHHVNPLDRKQRSVNDLKDLSNLRLLCKIHHPDAKRRY